MVVARSKIFIKLIAAFSVATGTAKAITLPSRMPMLAKPAEAFDPGIEAWIATNVIETPVAEMNNDQVLAWVANKNPVARALILLETRSAPEPVLLGSTPQAAAAIEASNAQLAAMEAKNLDEIPLVIAAELNKPKSERSVLLSELFYSWRSIRPLAKGVEELGSKIFADEPVASCASQKIAFKGLTRTRIAEMSDEEIIQLINVSKNYSAPSHKRQYLEALAAALPEKRRQAVITPLRALAQDLPLLAQRFSWLVDDSDLSTMGDASLFVAARRELARKNCGAAERALVKKLEQKISKTSMTAAIATGVEIEKCYRPLKRVAQRNFWERVSPPLSTRYGKEGALWAKVRIGYLEWISTELESATTTYNEILAEAQPATEYRAIVAKAFYMLGKIADDQRKMEMANKYFSDYLSQFPEQEDFEFALNGIIVNLASERKWQEMIPYLTTFLAQQAVVHVDRRPVGSMAFALFWLGRAYLQTNHPDLAREMWRRLASEYYSTFYGAIGHYLLEQGSGQGYAIEPSRVTGFDFSKMKGTLSPLNQAAVTRAVEFVQAGIVDSARCEIDEIVPSSSSDYAAQSVKVMLLHSVGSWLDAIKIFDSIPRSYRGGLPVGFERVLFPRKYAEIVKDRSAKLTLDPDFVFALVRQESVFAKNATSPVGATGLMQLMPATARQEAGKLSNSYIDHATRSGIQSAIATPSALRDPEINVTLGVHHLWRLMNIYKSPVVALSSYNAGTAATQKWQKTIASDDWLTFIERIPYKETRSYVKLILRNYFYYSRWYDTASPKTQIHIDAVIQELLALSKNEPK